jgi:3-dehydroquinate dehydratase / shikimate dehydrogenase
MTRLCAAIMIADDSDAAAQISLAEEQGADLLELRVDRLAGEPQQVLALLERTGLPCIVTCRHECEGGDFAGPEEERLALFERLCNSPTPPSYLDVEWSRYRASALLREGLARLTSPTNPDGPGLILSAHDFEGRPASLLRTVADLAAEPACRVIKIAFRARSLRDCLDLFDLLAQRSKPTIALGMGEFGTISRVLAGKFGGLLTFASLTADSATAPGQLTLAEMQDPYRFRRLGPDTAVFGVVGYPVGHSLGPVIHNAGFERIGVDGVYLPLPVAPGWEPFKATLLTLLGHESLRLRGLSVTIPHKEHLLRLAREESWGMGADAEMVGAANTLAREADGWVVRNTDVTALRACLEEALGGRQAHGARAAVAGAGGVGRAAVAALRGMGAQVTVYNRTAARAEALAAAFDQGDGPAVSVAGLDELAEAGPDLIVNATSLGMRGGPNAEASPIPTALLRAGVVVLDTVYNPIETPLLRAARHAGCTAIDGLAMFIRQAAGQFEAWTGQRAPLALMRERSLSRLDP